VHSISGAAVLNMSWYYPYLKDIENQLGVFEGGFMLFLSTIFLIFDNATF
jgi:hypothetical protein